MLWLFCLQITFESVGGLGPHIQKLKEMVVFPMLYPDYFKRLNMAPPRGCLFYGPPGTGKTHMARALANECSQGEKRVAFFMRKGADCLSKWVGESERQLRALFDQVSYGNCSKLRQNSLSFSNLVSEIYGIRVVKEMFVSYVCSNFAVSELIMSCNEQTLCLYFYRRISFALPSSSLMRLMA
jgi:Cdc6-like AAA superfamily ATPase